MSVRLQVLSGTLDLPYCMTSFQKLLTDFSAQMYVDLSSVGSFVNYGDTEPSVDNRDYPWIRTVGGRLEGVYNWLSGYGVWGRPYLDGALTNNNTCMIWLGDPADVPLIDGGTAGTATATTGPFWEVVTELACRMPMGAGTFPTIGTAVGFGTTYGVEQITLGQGNIPPHKHAIPLKGYHADSGSGVNRAGWDEPEALDDSLARNTDETGGAGDPKVAEPFNIIPPVYAVTFIRRTARIYVTV